MQRRQMSESLFVYFVLALSGGCMDAYLLTKNKDHLKKASIYLGIIVAFMISAIIESILIHTLAETVLYFSVVMLILAFVLMI